METNISNDCLWSREKAPLMGEAFNWMRRQVRLEQAVKFPVKCLHPRISFESQTLQRVGAIYNLVAVKCWFCGICWPGLLLICFWLAFIADILESRLSSSRSILLTVASCLSGASWMCTVQSMDHWSIFLFLLSFNSIQRSEMSSGHPWGWGWISRSWDEDSRYLKS